MCACISSAFSLSLPLPSCDTMHLSCDMTCLPCCCVMWCRMWRRWCFDCPLLHLDVKPDVNQQTVTMRNSHNQTPTRCSTMQLTQFGLVSTLAIKHQLNECASSVTEAGTTSPLSTTHSYGQRLSQACVIAKWERHFQFPNNVNFDVK